MDFLEEKRDEIQARLADLRPAVEEYAELQAAAAALEGVSSNGSDPAAKAVKRAKSVPVKASQPMTGVKRGRPKGTGKRAKEALEILRETPGLTVKQIAENMGIKQNYLYRVLPAMAEDGLVTQDPGKGWHVVGE